ncbi:MAG: tetratricopeptide repeat protein, partial [Nitrospinota bacterium]|nr:tetratricopeptide repeat protein [Nitrospinota bacterium]
TEVFYNKLVYLYLSNGQLDQAITVCRNGLNRFPKNSKLLLALAEVLTARGENEEALSYLNQVSINPHTIKALLLSGLIQTQNQYYSQAEQTLTQLVHVDPGNPLGYHLLGRNYVLTQQYREAEKNLRKALTLRPSLTNARILLAWIMESVGKLKQAEDEYKILRKINPENREIQEKLEQLKFANNKETDNITASGNAGTIPDDSDLNLVMGMIFFEQSLYLRALKEFRLFLSQEKDNKEVRLLIAKIYELYKNYSKAIDELETLIELDPQSVEFLLQIARMHHLNENTDRAVDYLQKAAYLQPDDDQIYHSLSLAYLSKNQQEKAIEFIRKALALAPEATSLNNKKATYYFELGALLEQVDQVDEAIESMREVLRINPRHSNAHNFIGYLYALQGEKLDKAIDHLEKALAVQPQNGYFLDSLGWIYYRQGNSEQALAEIKKAMIYTSPDPVIYDHLGDIHFDLKNYEEAGRAWKISLSLTHRKIEEASPDSELPDVNTLEEKLQNLDHLLKQSF